MPTRREFQFNVSDKNFTLLSGSDRRTVYELLEDFPYEKLLVLDYAVPRDGKLDPDGIWDGRDRFLGHHYVAEEQDLLNIDHHNPETQTDNWSTTNQLLSAINEGIVTPEASNQIVHINHDDTDSILAMLIATHAGIPKKLHREMARAAVGADHTGEHFTLVDIIDAFYKTRNIHALIPVINQYLRGDDLLFPEEEQIFKFERYQRLPQEILEYIEAVLYGEESAFGTGFYDQEAQILYLEPTDEQIDTIRALPIIRKLKLPVQIVMTSNLKDEATDDWKISLRSGPNFPKHSTLMDLAERLGLEEYGYGGRKNAGGIGRYEGKKKITPREMHALLQKALLER